MILAAILCAGGGAIVISEMLGRRTVVYARFLGLFLSYVACCALAGGVVIYMGGGLPDAAAVAASVVPILAAWLGFRIHLTNSISLEMAGLLEDGVPRSLPDIVAAYDVDAHTATRVEILRASGYFVQDGSDTLVDTPRSRFVLLLIRHLCGPEGPRVVAASLAHRERHSPSD